MASTFPASPALHTSPPYDCIVIGLGGVGSAALHHIARRGARVLGIERWAPGHGRGSSHGDTRIFRTAYFEHPDYVPLLQRAREQWIALQDEAGRQLYWETGLLEIGPPEGEVVSGVLKSAALHGLAVKSIDPAEAMARWPGFRIPEGMRCVFEKQAGFLRVEDAVIAQAKLAKKVGAELLLDEEVRSWRELDGAHGGVEVVTDKGVHRAARLAVAPGAWATSLLPDVKIPWQLRRKALFWQQPIDDVYALERDCPCYVFDLAEGIFYGFPQIDEYGVKIAEHSGGQPFENAKAPDRLVNAADVRQIETFAARCLPKLTTDRNRHEICMYTMTPDEHFVVDAYPNSNRVAFAAGLSGHGFKFTTVLGEALADLAMEGRTNLPIKLFCADRFE